VTNTPGFTPLIWATSPNNFIFIDTDLETETPVHSPNGSITVALTFNIAGAITYCSSPLAPPVANVTLNLTGTATASTLSDSSGNYALSSVSYGGNYTVTPTKAPRLPSSAGITSVDIVAVQRHFLQIASLPPGCPTQAADVTGDGSINGIDVIAIQRFFLGFSTGIGNVGRYKFTPTNRTYSNLTDDQAAQNYDSLVYGDVVSPFVEP
jgi:hypothetical protein